MRSLTPFHVELLRHAASLHTSNIPSFHLFGVQKDGSSAMKNVYDDIIGYVDYKRECGALGIGTVDPGKAPTLNPEGFGQKGVAHLDFGWHEGIWVIGGFRKSKPNLYHIAYVSRHRGSP